MKRISPLLTALLLTSTSCASAPAPVAEQPAEQPAEQAPGVSEKAAFAAFDDTTPVGAQMKWLLGWMSGEHAVTNEQLEARLSPEFQAALPPDQVRAVIEGFAAVHGTPQVVSVVSANDHELVLRTRVADSSHLLISMVVTPTEPHAIAGLLFSPAPPEAADLPASWEAIEQELAGLGGSTHLYVARIDDGECKPVHTVNAEAPLALGSTFKFYVLGALAEKIDAGEASWEDELAIDEAHKSLPSGMMQNEAAGAQFTLGHYADLMISISDNTATDHLLAFVGRERVERFVETTGHHAPALNRPFHFTHEFMKFKLGMTEDEVAGYLGLDEDGRRRFLDETLHDRPLPPIEAAADWTSARHIDTLEWFATGQDLCQLHAHFIDNRRKPAYGRALHAMALNNGGLSLSRDNWVFVGFKGGSEPGVLYMSWLLRRGDGAWYSLNLGVNHAEGDVTTALQTLAWAASAQLER